MTPCPGCGVPVSAAASFCARCGRPLSTSPGSTPARDRAPEIPVPTSAHSTVPRGGLPGANPQVGQPTEFPFSQPNAVPIHPPVRRTYGGVVGAVIAGAVVVTVALLLIGYAVVNRSANSNNTASSGSTAITTAPIPSASRVAPPTPVATAPASAPSANPAIIVTGDAAFMSPSGNLVCWLDASRARCVALIHDWPMAPRDPICSPTQESNSVVVTATGAASYGCILDVMDNPAIIGSGGPVPSWYDPNRDHIVGALDGSGWSGYALAYGQTIRVGPMECSVAESGVSCRNAASGHWFSANRTQALVG